MGFRNVIVFILFSLVFIGNAQDTNGKWIRFKNPNQINYKNVDIICLNKDSMLSYDFDKFISKTKIKIYNNRILLDDSISINYTLNGNDILELKSSNDTLRDDGVVRYFRLLPTKDTLSLVDKIDGTSYAVQLKEDYFIFKIGEKLESENAIIINLPQIATDMVCVNKLMDTYFLCFYLLGKLNYAFPIKELKESSMVIYGIPFHDGEITIEKLG